MIEDETRTYIKQHQSHMGWHMGWHQIGTCSILVLVITEIHYITFPSDVKTVTVNYYSRYGLIFFFELFFIEVIYVTCRGTRRWAMKTDAPAKSVASRVRDVWFELFVIRG